MSISMSMINSINLGKDFINLQIEYKINRLDYYRRKNIHKPCTFHCHIYSIMRKRVKGYEFVDTAFIIIHDRDVINKTNSSTKSNSID